MFSLSLAGRASADWTLLFFGILLFVNVASRGAFAAIKVGAGLAIETDVFEIEF